MTISAIFQHLRRLAGGASGSPTLQSGQLFSNEQENVLYIGTGNNGSGVATANVKIGGSGAFMDLSSTQTIAGAKTFTGTMGGTNANFSGTLTASSVNPNNINATGSIVATGSLTGGSILVKASGIDVTGVSIFRSAVTAPSPSASDTSTNVATTAFVNALLSNSSVLGAILATLPTSPPSSSGQAWLDNGTLRVS